MISSEDLAFQIVSHILSIIVLCCIVASFFFSAIYIAIFALKPYDPESKDEEKSLLAQATVLKDDEDKSTWYFWVQTTLLAVVYCGIQAAWFNSNKVLMQLSWPSETNEEIEVLND